MDPDQTAHMSSLVWVLTFCLKTSDTFRRMTGEKTLVVIGALGIELHFFRVRKYHICISCWFPVYGWSVV